MQVVSARPYLTTEERKELMKKNDWIAAFEVFINWTWITSAFLLVWFTFDMPYINVLTIIIALFVIGGKQLACAILMHDTSHRSVFKSEKLSEFIGQWFGAYPIFQDMIQYRPYHLKHHINTGLETDPDVNLTRGYPTSRNSMIRKLTRDLLGITGIRAFFGLLMMQMGYLEYNLGNNPKRVSQKGRSFGETMKRFWDYLAMPIFANIIIFLILFFTMSGWMYLLWIGAYITTFQFSLRIRSMAEHSMVDERENPIKNTRTTYANPIERVLFAPYHVNYHVEHHMLMGVPSYNFKKMHAILLQKGFYEEGVLEKNYWRIIKRAIKK